MTGLSSCINIRLM